MVTPYLSSGYPNDNARRLLFWTTRVLISLQVMVYFICPARICCLFFPSSPNTRVYSAMWEKHRLIKLMHLVYFVILGMQQLLILMLIAYSQGFQQSFHNIKKPEKNRKIHWILHIWEFREYWSSIRKEICQICLKIFFLLFSLIVPSDFKVNTFGQITFT